MDVQMSLLYANLHSFDHMPKSGKVESYVLLGFWGSSIRMPIEATLIYIPTNSV
jgi:hypothetical protein